MSYNNLLQLSTYNNDKDVKLYITAHDYIGNEIFKPITMYYKLGEHIHFDIPQYENYYVQQEEIDFCIFEDTNIELLYIHLIDAHIDITNDDDKVVYCGPITTSHDAIEYNERKIAHLPLNGNEGPLRITNVPCAFEGVEFEYRYPIVEGYYTDTDTISIIVAPWVVLHKKYHQMDPIQVRYIGEEDEILFIDIIEPTQDNLRGKKLYYTVSDDFIKENTDDAYYYSPIYQDGEPIYNLEFTLDGKINIFDIKLVKYRDIIIQYVVYEKNENGNSTTTQIEDSPLETITYEHHKIGDKFNISIPHDYEKNGIKYYTNTPEDNIYEVGAEYGEYGVVTYCIEYLRYIKFNIYCMCNGIQIGEEEVDCLYQNVTYTYKSIDIPGYYTHTPYIYLRDWRDKTIHIMYHKETD